MNAHALAELLQRKFGASFTPQEMQELIQTTDTGGRSPLRPRQLHDLRLLPRADDPRPTFFATAEVPRDWVTTTQKNYPRLMWAPSGQEITIPDTPDAEKVQKGYEAKGYSHTPPADVTPMDAIEREMRQLSEEDRAFVLEEQRKARMSKLQAKIANLSDADLATIAGPAPKRGKA